jgi:hypothetical protein
VTEYSVAVKKNKKGRGLGRELDAIYVFDWATVIGSMWMPLDSWNSGSWPSNPNVYKEAAPMIVITEFSRPI